MSFQVNLTRTDAVPLRRLTCPEPRYAAVTHIDETEHEPQAPTPAGAA